MCFKKIFACIWPFIDSVAVSAKWHLYFLPVWHYRIFFFLILRNSGPNWLIDPRVPSKALGRKIKVPHCTHSHTVTKSQICTNINLLFFHQKKAFDVCCGLTLPIQNYQKHSHKCCLSKRFSSKMLTLQIFPSKIH